MLGGGTVDYLLVRRVPEVWCAVVEERSYADKDMGLGPPTVPILGNEHQIPAADGHFLYVTVVFIFFSFLFSSSLANLEAQGLEAEDCKNQINAMVSKIWRYFQPKAIHKYHARHFRP